MIETLLLGPLKLVFEVIFSIADRVIGHPGLAIVVLSLIMNILVLPLYRRADAMQEEARDVDAKLRDGVAHIKKTFSGDERMMIMQAYYRQNNYSPLSALKGSVSLLLEIPFFMAAYQFLSNLTILDGVSLGPIANLGAPDGLIRIGGLTLNLLPILMTLINVISSYIYLKGFPLKTKIQLYAMALFFLFFLYDSPACLVFYWTLNNLFSLVKTIFYKLKNPKKVLTVLTAVLGLASAVFGLFVYDTTSMLRKVFFVGVGVALLCPLALSFVKRKATLAPRQAKPNKAMFWLGCVFMAVLTGLLIPSTFIAASPQEFVDITLFYHPLWYIASAACFALGTFVVWFGVFYWLASPSGKAVFDKLIWVLCGGALVNYMFFGTDLGVILPNLQYENPNALHFTSGEQLINAAVLVALAAVLILIAVKWRKVAVPLLLTMVIAVAGMSVPNVVTIQQSVAKVSTDSSVEDTSLHLSKTGQNVVVIMLDRAMGEYIPYLFNENPALKEKFAGFTYYDNVVSHGKLTNFGSPSFMGGYEYTPVEMNKRDDVSLKDKQNEAILVMPRIFADEGYDVTVCDPPYANYQWIPDLSIFDEYPNIRGLITEGQYGNIASKKMFIAQNTRNFFCFSLMKSLPLSVQRVVYNRGAYNSAAVAADSEYTTPQEADGLLKAVGVSDAFVDSYTTLMALPSITDANATDQNTYTFICNNATHEPQLMQLPDYTLSQTVDNTAYADLHGDGITLDGRTLEMDELLHVTHYHANMASLSRVAEWLDYLRKQGVYDNTRIILASDHGRSLYQMKDLLLPEGYTVESFFPLLMVKDFGSKEFTVSSEFMTTADIPTLATAGLVDNPVNPFTGKAINSDEKTAHDQMLTMSGAWETWENNGNTFVPSGWMSVRDNLWDNDNWTVYPDEIVLKEHALPQK